MKIVLKLIYRLLLLLVVCSTGSGCRTYQAINARYRSPDYVITADFYSEAPQRVAILPFASRGSDDKVDWRAKACRRVFFQEFCVKEFEDFDLWRVDQLLARESTASEHKLGFVGSVLKFMKSIDAVGMSSLFDLKALISRDPLGTTDFNKVFDLACNKLQADACVTGISRNYGRIYAVVFSTVGMSSRVEMRSSRTGQLLWRGQTSMRSYEIPLTLNPLDLPSALYYTWRNSNGSAMDVIAYEAYKELIATIPYVEKSTKAFARTTGKAPYFGEPTIWMFMRKGVLQKDMVMPFKMEQNGWMLCGLPDGSDGWLLKSDCLLQDENGRQDCFHRHLLLDNEADCPECKAAKSRPR